MNSEMLSMPDAANRLSVTTMTAYRLMESGRLTQHGRPARVAANDVARLIRERQREAAASRPDWAAFAQVIRERLHPSLPDPAYARAFEIAAFIEREKGRKVVPRLHPDAKAMWGDVALNVAAETWPVNACKTCFVNISARVLGTPDPRPTQDWAILLGEPCGKDRHRWAEEEAQHEAVLAAGARIQLEDARKQAAAKQAAEVAAAKIRIRRDTAIIAAGTADTVTVRRGGVTRRQAPGRDDGADLTESILAKLEGRRRDAAARGDQTAVATLNGQISRLRMGDR